jgi:hypothetical protein
MADNIKRRNVFAAILGLFGLSWLSGCSDISLEIAEKRIRVVDSVVYDEPSMTLIVKYVDLVFVNGRMVRTEAVED